MCLCTIGTVCDMRPEVAEHVWSIWSWTTELLVFLLVPLAILILNILVIVATQRIADNMERLLDAGRRAYYMYTSLWNSLHVALRDRDISLEQFKRLLKTLWFV